MPAKRPVVGAMPIAWTSTGVVPPVLADEDQLRDLLAGRVGDELLPAVGRQPGSSTRRRRVEKWRSVSSAGVKPVSRSMASERYVNMPSRVGREDHVRRVLDEEPVALLGLGQLAGQPLLLADVADRPLDAGEDFRPPRRRPT